MFFKLNNVHKYMKICAAIQNFGLFSNESNSFILIHFTRQHKSNMHII